MKAPNVVDDFVHALVRWIATRQKSGKWRDDAAAVASRIARYDRQHPGARDEIIADAVMRLTRMNIPGSLVEIFERRCMGTRAERINAILQFYASREGYKAIVRALDASRKLFIRDIQTAEKVTAVASIPITLETPGAALERQQLLAEEERRLSERDGIEAAEDRALSKEVAAWFLTLRKAREKAAGRLLVETTLSNREIEKRTGVDRRRVAVLRTQLTEMADRILTGTPDELEQLKSTSQQSGEADAPTPEQEKASAAEDFLDIEAEAGWDKGATTSDAAGDALMRHWLKEGSRGFAGSWNNFAVARFVVKDAIERSRLVWGETRIDPSRFEPREAIAEPCRTKEAPTYNVNSSYRRTSAESCSVRGKPMGSGSGKRENGRKWVAGEQVAEEWGSPLYLTDGALPTKESLTEHLVRVERKISEKSPVVTPGK